MSLKNIAIDKKMKKLYNNYAILRSQKFMSKNCLLRDLILQKEDKYNNVCRK